MSQSTLGDFTNTSPKVKVTAENSTLILGEDHINYLIEHCSEEYNLQQQIEDHILEEQVEMEDIKQAWREFSQYDKPKESNANYLRVRRNQ